MTSSEVQMQVKNITVIMAITAYICRVTEIRAGCVAANSWPGTRYSSLRTNLKARISALFPPSDPSGVHSWNDIPNSKYETSAAIDSHHTINEGTDHALHVLGNKSSQENCTKSIASPHQKDNPVVI
jgi:hypothetical protein